MFYTNFLNLHLTVFINQCDDLNRCVVDHDTKGSLKRSIVVLHHTKLRKRAICKRKRKYLHHAFGLNSGFIRIRGPLEENFVKL